MASFIHGDQPVVTFGYAVPDAAEGAASGTLSVAGQTVPASILDDEIVGNWSDLTLPAVGSYPIYLVVTTAKGSQRFLLDTLVVVDPEDQWFNVVTARLEWDGAPNEDGTLHRLLTVSRDQVEAYAPDLRGASVPERYRSGQLMQARNTHNASLTNGDAQVDAGGFVVNVRPLDWAVKQLLRPQRAKKGIR